MSQSRFVANKFGSSFFEASPNRISCAYYSHCDQGSTWIVCSALLMNCTVTKAFIIVNHHLFAFVCISSFSLTHKTPRLSMHLHNTTVITAEFSCCCCCCFCCCYCSSRCPAGWLFSLFSLFSLLCAIMITAVLLIVLVVLAVLFMDSSRCSPG